MLHFGEQTFEDERMIQNCSHKNKFMIFDNLQKVMLSFNSRKTVEILFKSQC